MMISWRVFPSDSGSEMALKDDWSSSSRLQDNEISASLHFGSDVLSEVSRDSVQ